MAAVAKMAGTAGPAGGNGIVTQNLSRSRPVQRKPIRQKRASPRMSPQRPPWTALPPHIHRVSRTAGMTRAAVMEGRRGSFFERAAEQVEGAVGRVNTSATARMKQSIGSWCRIMIMKEIGGWEMRWRWVWGEIGCKGRRSFFICAGNEGLRSGVIISLSRKEVHTTRLPAPFPPPPCPPLFWPRI